MSHEKVYRTVDIDRRGYGRRYTWLPVDSLSRQGFSIDCTDAYIRPDMIDIRPGDIVRWKEGDRKIEGTIIEVQRNHNTFLARVEDAHPLPPEVFYP
jgi:hypothetical protein